MKSTHFLLMTSMIAAMAACDSSSTAPVDNSAATTMDEHFAASRAADNAAQVGLNGVVADSDLAMGSTDLEIPAAGQTLVAGRMLADVLVKKDTIIGALWISTTTRGLWTKVDSIQFLPEDLVNRDSSSIRATKVVSRVTGPAYIQRTVLLDGDGDGYVIGNKSEEKIVKLEVTKTVGAVTEISHIVSNSGPDGNIFTGSDNQVYSLDWTRMRGSDTVRSVKLYPLAGDTVVSGDGKALRTFGATLHKKGPLVVRDLDLVVRAKGTDTAIVGLSGSSRWTNGRVETISVKSLSGAASVGVGDTAVLRIDVQAPSADSVVSSSFTAHVLPGSGLGKPDSRVILIEGSRQFRVGRIAKETFRLASPEGIRDGQTPTSGSFSWKAELRDGGTISLVGTFTATGTTGTWTSQDGTTKQVTTTN